MKHISAFLALSVTVLYPTAFWICEYMYPGIKDIDSWRFLRDTLKGIEVFFLAAIYIMPKNRIAEASMYALLILCGGNLFDRFVFGIFDLIWTDYILIIMSIVIFIIKLNIPHEANTRRSNKRNNENASTGIHSGKHQSCISDEEKW